MKKINKLLVASLIITSAFAQVTPGYESVSVVVTTEYSGDQTINTAKITEGWAAGQYVLIDLTRGIQTLTSKGYAYQTVNNQSWEQTVQDNTPDGSMNPKTKAALDAHWGVAMTYDYFKSVHGRDGFDGHNTPIAITLATQKRGENLYGQTEWHFINGEGKQASIIVREPSTFNGTDGFLRQTSLDVMAHEYGHGVAQGYLGLNHPVGESGAINEGLSDIWAVCVENYAGTINHDDLWSIGEDFDKRPGKSGLRKINNPGYADQPDTYLGNNWADTNPNSHDQGGIHTNMSIMSYWFYLLCEGGSGINDNGTNYDVSGIGIQKAEKIVYKAITEKFTETINHHDAAKYMYDAAVEMYGRCPDTGEAQAVVNAWKAVGITNTVDLPTLISDCNGNCAPESWLGNNLCDNSDYWHLGELINFSCSAFNFDQGDCDCSSDACPPGKVLDCDGSGDCWPQTWIGDGYCDGNDQQYGANLLCHDDDGGDCGTTPTSTTTCPSGEILDCDGSGECHPESWIGDGYCDGNDQQYGANLLCHNNDGGDCETSTSAASCRLESPIRKKKEIKKKEIANSDQELTTYFNPRTNLLTLEIVNYGGQRLDYQLYDVLGGLLDQNKVIGSQTNISMENLPAGAYVLMVHTEKENIKTFKIVKN